MSDKERIEQLEDIVLALLSALRRKGAEQDGNWGWPHFLDEVKCMEDLLSKPQDK